MVNANFNPDGNCNVNWNLKPDNANDNLGVRSVIVSGISRRHLLKDASFFIIKLLKLSGENLINDKIMITIDDFLKVELRVGTVLEAEEVEGSEKLIKLKVDLGEEEPRQILADVKQWYKPKDFVGKQVVVVANLEPKMIMGLESQGMMLAADSEDGPVFLSVPKKVPAGTKVR